MYSQCLEKRNYMKNILFSFIIMMLCSNTYPTIAQADIHEAENKVHSVFIYNFIKYVQWPEDYSTGDFTIGILGDTNLDEELQKLAAIKTVNGRKISIKKYKDVGSIEKKCNILFLTSESSTLLSDVLKKINGNSTLLITHKEGLGKFGSLINFVSENGRYRFEINITAFEKSKLKFEQQLKAVAILI